MSAPEPQVTTAAIDVLYDFLWEPDDETSREECAQVIADILRASDVVPADALRALIEQWRSTAGVLSVHYDATGEGELRGRSKVYQIAADELEAAMEAEP